MFNEETQDVFSKSFIMLRFLNDTSENYVSWKLELAREKYFGLLRDDLIQ
jgi:hypothetical protein